MPAVCHFYSMQPSEFRLLKRRDLNRMIEYMNDYHRAMNNAAH